MTKTKDERRRKSLEGMNRSLNPHTIPGYIDACRLATEAEAKLYGALAALNIEPGQNLDRIQGLVKALKALDSTGLVSR